MRESDRRMTRRRVMQLLRTVRWRWRTRLALRGLAWTGAVAGSTFFVSALVLEQLRFAPEAVVWLRAIAWGTLAISAVGFLIRPLLRRVSDEQVALYLEEHEASLEHTVVSALDAREGGPSPALTDRLVESALERARRVDNGRRVEQSSLYRVAGALVAVTVLGAGFALLGPAHLRTGLAALLMPTRDAASVNPYAVSVLPGDTTIARGTDQLVVAELAGFESAGASIFTRTGPDDAFQRLSMLPGLDGGFEMLLLGVDDRTEYFVEATGIRSPIFTIDVADLPYVDRLDLTYYFPRYTGLQPRTLTDGGDVAALRGTVVELKVQPTMITPGGRILIDGEAVTELEATEDGTLVGRFTVRAPGFYSVELARDNGEMVPASPEYTIDVLTDQAPSVQFTKPGRDDTASPIEEVYLEVRADDDYGIGDIRVVYSVNGGSEDTVSIFQASGAPLAEVSTGHTLFLEEWELEPGDLISYYALVRDNRNRSSSKSVASDIYFVSVRPFERAYRQGEQRGGQPQGGGQAPESALSELQRQIIAATFNLIRQRDSYEPEEFSENIVSVSLAQGRLQEQVNTLLERMKNRGLTESDPGFRDVSAILPLALEAMTAAREALDAEELKGALPDEQTALRFLQQAEETYERYLVEQQQGGGSSAGDPSAAEDLADLFELELDKLKNQYETVRRGQQQEADNQVDEVLERLKELSKRQEKEAERQRRRSQRGQQGAAGGGAASQRELAEDTEEAARQLQRLARETNDAQLEETARRLQQAAEAMRQSASQSGSAGGAEAESALDRLEEARRRLETAQSERTRRDAEDAMRRVEELQRQQRAVQRQVRELPGPGAARNEQIGRLRERKDQMTEAVRDIERALDRAAGSGRSENPKAARALQEAANQIRESKLKEKLQYSRGTIEQRDPETAATLEMAIEGDLQALRDQLERAANESSERQADPLEEALEGTRDLVRGMEAMNRRLSEPGGEPGDGQQGQGQEGAAGQAQNGARRGSPTDAADTPFGGATGGAPRPLSPDEIRQFRREFGQRGEQLRGLQNQLREAGVPTGELQAAVDAMARLQRQGIYSNPAQVAELQNDILDRLKRLEFGLRRQVEGETGRGVTLTGSDEVPDGYRKLVEEYYRALARGRARGGGD
jgi:Domain of unknown function (DUF4175)